MPLYDDDTPLYDDDTPLYDDDTPLYDDNNHDYFPPTMQEQPTSGVSTRVSRHGSIIIERSAAARLSAPAAAAAVAYNDSPPPPLPNTVDSSVLKELRSEHEVVVQHLRSKITQLHEQCVNLHEDNQDIMNELNVVRTRMTHLQGANMEVTEEEEERRVVLSRTRTMLQSKDNELRLLRDQQDRTMTLLHTCTEQRDLLVNDNRMLRQELDQLLRRLNYDDDQLLQPRLPPPSSSSSVPAARSPTVRRSPPSAARSSPSLRRSTPVSRSSPATRSSPASASSKSSPKIFVSTNRRGTFVNPRDSRFQVINAKTSAATEWKN